MKQKNNWVVGSPIIHSKSPILHNTLYDKLNISAQMQSCEYLDPKLLVSDIRSKKIDLVAVTMPLKERVTKYLDELRAAASKLNLVNTIINQDGCLIGYNTDLDGIDYVFKDIDLHNKKVVILGAGAVAKICGYYLRSKAANLYWSNRTREKAVNLAKIYGGRVINEDNVNADVIINTTALGMVNNLKSPIRADLIHSGQIVFDVVYNPLETELLKLAKKSGAKSISGLDMFIVQALRQIEILENKTIISEEVINQAREIVKRGIEK